MASGALVNRRELCDHSAAILTGIWLATVIASRGLCDIMGRLSFLASIERSSIMINKDSTERQSLVQAVNHERGQKGSNDRLTSSRLDHDKLAIDDSPSGHVLENSLGGVSVMENALDTQSAPGDLVGAVWETSSPEAKRERRNRKNKRRNKHQVNHQWTGPSGWEVVPATPEDPCRVVPDTLGHEKIRFAVAGGSSDEFTVLRYRGVEGLSQLFRFDLELRCAVVRPDMRDLIGRSAALLIESGAQTWRWFHGLVQRFDVLEEVDGVTLCRVELVPNLWQLTQRYGSRIFQNQNIAEILHSVLDESGICTDAFDLRLRESHAVREYTVQYRETDFAFISRLMEEEGIYYFFEHLPDQSRLIITDCLPCHPWEAARRTLPFVPPSGQQAAQDHIHRFRLGEELRTGVVTLRDFNFEKPRVRLECHDDLERNPNLEFSDYPGNYADQDGGRRVARLRAEEFECRKRAGTGASHCGSLFAGGTFRLAEHPRAELNNDYLITRLLHTGSQPAYRATTAGSVAAGAADGALQAALRKAAGHADETVRELGKALESLLPRLIPQREDALPAGAALAYQNGRVGSDASVTAAAQARSVHDILPGGCLGSPLPHVDLCCPAIYSCEFECVPAAVPYRPARLTPWPFVRGCQTAIVVGPKGEEIHTDEFGRVKVQFHWDRDGRMNENSSCWVRVNQPWAGVRFGGMAIPRVGQEVIVSFLEGDPDRPIIVGRVYNADSMPPESLPPRDPERAVAPGPRPGNKPPRIPKSRTSLRSNSYPGGGGANEMTMDDTKGNEHFFLKAQHDQTEEVGNNRMASVKVDSTEIIGNNDAQMVGNNKSCDVTNAYNVNCDTMLVNAKTSITLQCGASRIHMNQAGFISITGNVITSAAAINNSVIAPMTEIVGAAMLAEAGAVVEIVGGVTHMRAASLAGVNSGGKVNVVAGGDNIIQGAKVKIN